MSRSPASHFNGYILEFAIPKARLGELGLAARALPGLNWTLIDDDDGGNAEAKLEWREPRPTRPTRPGPTAAQRPEPRFGRRLATPTPTPTATPTVPTPTTTSTPTVTPHLPLPQPDAYSYAIANTVHNPLGNPGDENWAAGVQALWTNNTVRALAVDGERQPVCWRRLHQRWRGGGQLHRQVE